jgi:hypothetical protein
LAHHLQRDPLGAVRYVWNYRRSTPPSKVLIKFGIERHGRKASGTSRSPPMYRWRCPHAERLAHHLERDPLGAVRKFWDYRVLIPSSKVLIKIEIERHGRKASGTGRGPPIYPGRRRDASRALGSPPLTRPARCCTQLWDYRRPTPPSKVLVKIGIERHGRNASGTGRGPPILSTALPAPPSP